MNLAVLCRRAEKLLALKPVPGRRYQRHACKKSANTTKDEKGLVFSENSHLKVEIGRFSRSGARLWGPLARPGGETHSPTHTRLVCAHPVSGATNFWRLRSSTRSFAASPDNDASATPSTTIASAPWFIQIPHPRIPFEVNPASTLHSIPPRRALPKLLLRTENPP